MSTSTTHRTARLSERAVSQEHHVSEEKSSPSGRSLSRTVINFWLDCLLLIVFLVLVTASAVLRFVFPVGTNASGWTVWGYGFNEWHNFEFASLCVLAAGIVLHVMLHWTWVCGVIGRKLLGRRGEIDDGIRTLYGVGLLVVLLHIVGGIVAVAYLTVQPPL